MLETIITSSVLIIAVILLRYVLKGKINVRLQYALWLLVAVRLLLPFSLLSSSLSILNIVDIGRQTTQVIDPVVLPPSETTGVPYTTNEEVTNPVSNLQPIPEGAPAGTAVTPIQKASLSDILYKVWLFGAAAVGLWFVLQNIRFASALRKTRKAADIEGIRLPVYLTQCVKSPCLFGLFRPAIYIHPDSLADTKALNYILAHEETHYRHRDHFWSYLRCVCLAVHWFNPLVWWAAVLSRRDCEIACDESTLKHIGDEHRRAYGNTLINMIARRSKPSDLLCGATTMTSGKAGIKERITMIAKKPRMLISTLLAVILIMATIVGCTFTGANQTKIKPLTNAELSYFNGDEFFNGEYLNIRNQFLSSIYESPKKIDIFQLFYNGDNGDVATEAERVAVVAQNGWDAEPDTVCQKISRGKIDDVLAEYTALTLSDTEKVGLENFTYLAEYDAYYDYHGDTNYRAKITFSRGEREGDIIRLFYDDVFFADGKKVLTLREKGDGYLFISNVFDGPPNEATTDVTLFELAGVTIAIPDAYIDQLLIDPVQDNNDTTLISVYQKSVYESEIYKGMGYLFSIVRYTQAQYEQFLGSDGSGQSFFAKDGTYYYGFFFATDVQYPPDDYDSFSALFSAVGDFVKSGMISRNGLTPYSDNEFFSRTYTYGSDHIFYKYYPYYAVNGSKEEVWTLYLSQPATQGDTGIWCVERWRDQLGSVYPYFPNENGKPSKDYYAALQTEADAGHLVSLLDPEQVAITFAEKVFGHSVTRDSFERTENSGIPSELFAMSTGNINDYMPKLIAGENVSAYDLLPCLKNFTFGTWSELNERYGGGWFDPLLAALGDAAVSDMRADSADQTMRNYYLGKAYLVADGAIAELLSDIVLRQWRDNSALYSAGLNSSFSNDEASRLRQSLLYLVSHRGGEFHLGVPGSDPELTLSLNAYPSDFPFGTSLTEISRKTFTAESFGQVTVVESDGLQVTFLHNTDGVYFVTSIRTVKQGWHSTGVAIGDPEEKLWEHWIPAQLRKLESISYDDEAWFGSEYDHAYVYTPKESTKSVVYLMRDGRVWGIELINGLDGAMYP